MKAQNTNGKSEARLKTPGRLLHEILEKYGPEPENVMTWEETDAYLTRAVKWANKHNEAVQDFFASSCEPEREACKYQKPTPRSFTEMLLKSLQEADEHLRKGRELGLSEFEQKIIDAVWGWIPHDYKPAYVDFAREYCVAIKSLLPTPPAKRDEESYFDFILEVIKEGKRLALKYDVDFRTDRYDVTIGYLFDQLSGLFKYKFKIGDGGLSGFYV